MFNEHLEKLFENVGFFKLCFYKMIWNLTGRKFQALLIALILVLVKEINPNILMITIAAYAGANVAEKWLGGAE